VRKHNQIHTLGALSTFEKFKRILSVPFGPKNVVLDAKATFFQNSCILVDSCCSKLKPVRT